MKNICSFLVLLFSAICIHAQSDFIQNVYARNYVNLDGRWHYIIDPYETGFRGFQGATADENNQLGGFFENQRQQSKSELIEYDFDASPTLNVPGDWNSQNDQLLYYEGTIWYERDFNFYPQPGKRYFLRFNAINYEAYVSLNDKKLGVHAGGFTPFEFEVTNQLNNGKNFIVVKVNDTRKKENVPTDNFDWWNYGGITGDVLLVEEPSTFIRDYKIQLAKNNLKRIEGYVQLDGEKLSQQIKVTIPETGLQTTISAGADGKASFSIPVKKLIYWSPENPKLYPVSIATDNDTVNDEIGFRTIEAKETDILLNGKPVFLRGIALHDENPLIPGRPRNSSDCSMLLSWAKELQCNFIRLAHYPHNEEESHLADSMGLLLWEEVPVYWTIDWTNDSTLKNAQHQITDLIQRDKNRASVIVWSIGNETPDIPEREKFMEAMADTAHALDDSRLVSAALLTRTKDDSVFVDDPLGKKLDIVSFNEYYGWYGGGMPWEINKFNFTIPYQKPVVISELGAGALAGFHADSATRFSEEYQECFYKNQMQLISKVPNLKGMTPWILVDFRSPKRMSPEYQEGWNRKGLISETGQKKKAFFVLRNFYLKKRQEYAAGSE
ncbi:MAG TPA: glycoside hydrolase family 2 TIM barrel-domain containing protein [Chitinophagaceae bacterium]|nr:glycoside hydrolase family 2 TIM barrel-domain containing protein [Chitinophagaceae bacterium]